MLIRPSAPSPKEQLTLVPFTSPMSSEDSWPSPDLSAIHSPETSKSNRSNRVSVLGTIGELLDSALLTSDDVSDLIEIIMRGEKDVAAVSDLLESRPCMRGKAQFLKLYLKPSSKREDSRGFTTPNPTYHEWQVSGLYHPPTPFVDIPSPLVRSASPPLRFPTAIRPAPVKLSCIKEDLVRMSSTESAEEPKFSPESFKSTNVGSSIDASTVSPPNGPPTRESTSSSVTPDKGFTHSGLVECGGDSNQ